MHAKLRKKKRREAHALHERLAELGPCPAIIRSVEDVYGWLLPTPVQQEAIPLTLGGGDVLAAAETGSGRLGRLPCRCQICHEALHEQQLLTSKPKGAAIGRRAAAAAAAAVSAQGISNDRDGLQCQQMGSALMLAGNAWAGGRAGWVRTAAIILR